MIMMPPLWLLARALFIFSIGTVAFRAGRKEGVGLRQKLPSPTGLLASSCRSWDELSLEIGIQEETKEYVANNMEGPLSKEDCELVLYRDRHGWCPYSERVWLGLLHKRLDFREVLVDNLGSKPSWYYQEAPSGQTPALRFPDGRTKSESLDLLYELDNYFPNAPSLMPKEELDPELYKSAREIIQGFRSYMPKNTRPSSRGAFLFRGGGGPVFRKDLEGALDGVEALLGRHPGGPFFLGAFGAADCAFAPFLERWAVQLPLLHRDLRPRGGNWPRLARWYDAMDQEVPGYLSRVRGDTHTWAYVLADAAGGGLADQIWADEIGALGVYGWEDADLFSILDLGNRPGGATGKTYLELWEGYRSSAAHRIAATPGLEAARRLVANHKLVARDAARHAGGLSEATAEVAVQLVADSLVRADSSSNKEPKTFDMERLAADLAARTLEMLPDPEQKAEAARFPGYFAGRVCTPRDTGLLPSKALRAHLALLGQVLPDYSAS